MILHVILAAGILSAFCEVGTAVRPNDEILEIPQGKLAGEWRTSFGGRPFTAFEGIPYAKPPVKKLRFEDPQTPKKWNGVLSAKTLPSVCTQWINAYKDVTGKEDCLYLNVYSPAPNKRSSLPVIIFIHGGAFIYGTGNTYLGDYLMDRNVVYVILQYRLGALGFMSTQDSVLPGNLGLKDQNMAMRWVQKNIHHFGGNPKSVTITGMSAGGASVHYHLLSPMSKGLFHKAIAMSGTSFCPWTHQEAPLQKALLAGSSLGCPTSSTEELVECLKRKPAADIERTISKITMYPFAPFSPWAPVVEPSGVKGTFISSHPYDIVNSGQAQDIPLLLSVTSHEGLYPGAYYLQKPEHLINLAAKWESLAPHLFDFNYTLPLDKHADAAKKIKDYYFGGKDLSMETHPKFVDALGDRHFKVDVEKTGRLQALRGKSPVYYYIFSYRGATSLSDFHSHTDNNYGIAHGDDTAYVTKTDYMDVTTTEEDIKMIGVMTKMWASFAKDGVPDVGVEWPQVGKSEEMAYLDIQSPTKIVLKSSVYSKSDATTFWNSLELDENEKKTKIKKDEL